MFVKRRILKRQEQETILIQKIKLIQGSRTILPGTVGLFANRGVYVTNGRLTRILRQSDRDRKNESEKGADDETNTIHSIWHNRTNR